MWRERRKNPPANDIYPVPYSAVELRTKLCRQTARLTECVLGLKLWKRSKKWRPDRCLRCLKNDIYLRDNNYDGPRRVMATGCRHYYSSAATLPNEKSNKPTHFKMRHPTTRASTARKSDLLHPHLRIPIVIFFLVLLTSSAFQPPQTNSYRIMSFHDSTRKSILSPSRITDDISSSPSTATAAKTTRLQLQHPKYHHQQHQQQQQQQQRGKTIAARPSASAMDEAEVIETPAPSAMTTTHVQHLKHGHSGSTVSSTKRGDGNEKDLSGPESFDNDDLVPSKMSDAIRLFFLGGDKGPLMVVGIMLWLVFWRFGLMTTTTTPTVTSTLGYNGVGWKDFAVMIFSIILWWFQEHVLHEKVLHSDVDWIGKAVHQEHHDQPYHHVSIDSAPLLLTWMAVAHVVLFRWWLPLPLALSATIGYVVAGLTYEWSHYIVHTRVKFKNKFWVRVRDNHIRHHRISSDHWFSFTMPWVDDVFGTNPCIKDVQQRRQWQQQQLTPQRQRQQIQEANR